MYRVTIGDHFSAAHRLLLPDGGSEPLHGHNWSVEVGFCGQDLDESGVLVDFVEAKKRLAEVLAQLHHADLNACALMGGINPSAEHVARVIHQELANRVSRPDLLEYTRVEEEPGCWATFFDDARGLISRP